MQDSIRKQLIDWAVTYNDPVYFEEDPISFPRHFHQLMDCGKADLRDIEISAVFSAHLAWGRRCMIVRDCRRLFDQMDWKPYDYIMKGVWRSGPDSAHRTVRWDDVAAICRRLRDWYLEHSSLEKLDVEGLRRCIFGQKDDPSAANKKIHMMRRWMARRDGKVDLGLWKDTSTESLVIPLDVHSHRMAVELGLTGRRQKDIRTAMEITDCFRDIFPGDPCLGDFALFGYGVTHPKVQSDA